MISRRTAAKTGTIPRRSRSIDRSTQWAVFEPNGERLWVAIRGAVSDFLFNEWRSGALPGGAPEEAYFVRCDRSTMTQHDLDNGRLTCEIGVAVLEPAEFVIFRISQKTADARSQSDPSSVRRGEP
ncbi:MAG: phage tail sheath family protein [Acidimicrobiia bacterium]|nr:phage tail sheath family protein [Acidimicrobiia bacterium]